MEKTILGIDPGTGRMGWAIVSRESVVGSSLHSLPTTNNKQQTILVDCGLIETKANTPLPERLEIIYIELQKIIKKYKPDVMAIEELFFVKNVKTGISVAHARGVAMLSGVSNKLEVFEYKPNEIKLGICGFGHADKKQMSRMIELHIRGCKIKQDDTADAVAVALYHMQANNSRISPKSETQITPKNRKFPASPESQRELAPEREGKILYKDLSYQIVGVLYDCFNQIGGGLQERYYQALAKEKLREKNLSFEDQPRLAIRGLPSYMGRFFPDFVIENRVVLELKVGARIKKDDVNQVMAYLRQSKKQLAIIALFSQNGVDTRCLLLGFSGEISRN